MTAIYAAYTRHPLLYVLTALKLILLVHVLIFKAERNEVLRAIRTQEMEDRHREAQRWYLLKCLIIHMTFWRVDCFNKQISLHGDQLYASENTAKNLQNLFLPFVIGKTKGSSTDWRNMVDTMVSWNLKPSFPSPTNIN